MRADNSSSDVLPLASGINPGYDEAGRKLLLVGHTQENAQVLLTWHPKLLGSVVDVRVTSHTRWSVRGHVVEWVYCPWDETALDAGMAHVDAEKPVPVGASTVDRVGKLNGGADSPA